MALSDHPRAYGTAALTVAFAAGILVTLGFKDLYPELEGRYQRMGKHRGGSSSTGSKAAATGSQQRRRRRSSIFFGGPVQLEDHESEADEAANRTAGIVEGIEGCIGNTPL